MSGFSSDKERAELLSRYIREKVDLLLAAMNTAPLKADEIDDAELLDLDPLGTIADAFEQVIGHQHRMNDILREKEERFRTLAEFSTTWIFWRAPDGTFVYVSPACEKITGYHASEFIGDPSRCLSIVHPDDRGLWSNHVHKADEGGNIAPMEFRIFHRDGSIRWVSHVCRPIHDVNGVFLGVRVATLTSHARSPTRMRCLGPGSWRGSAWWRGG